MLKPKRVRTHAVTTHDDKVPPALEGDVRGVLHTRGVGLRSLEHMGPKRFVLSVDDDAEFRSRCE